MRRAVDGSSRAVFGGLFICVVLLVSLGFAGASEAAMDSYFIIDGPGVGVRLFTPHGELTVLPTNLVDAGHIGGTAGDHCNGALHFHGSITLRADPDPVACGWGKVVQVGDFTKVQISISLAIEAELLAQTYLGFEDPLYVNASDSLGRSVNHLIDLKTAVSAAKDSGQVDQRTADLITRQIDVAIKTEQGASAAVTRLKDGKGEPKDRKVADQAIRIALDDKARVFRSLRKATLIP